MVLYRHLYPFTAIVGQERMKLALILNAINPAIGGVLVRGEKGTGKSTAVRALARLLPEQRVVDGCHFGCDPDLPEAFCGDCRARSAGGRPLPVSSRKMRVVELPVNASEDRVVGAIDLESALRHGSRQFEPGILAEANRNVLYVDEVNLLDDHLVDALLDAAAMGFNRVEREGMSIVHPSRFQLVGTMNPEEGDLRPQLLDRFGLCVDVEGIRDVDERVLIMERESAFQLGDPAFFTPFAASSDELTQRLETAIGRLTEVRVSRAQAELISGICVEAGALGHRADVVIDRAVRALAAYNGRLRPTTSDIYASAELALAHRARAPVQKGGEQAESRPTEVGPPSPNAEQQQDRGERSQSNPSGPESTAQVPKGADESGSAGAGNSDGAVAEGSSGGDSVSESAELFSLKKIELPRERLVRRQTGKRAASKSEDKRGRYVSAQPKDRVTDLALDATIRAAAPHQAGRGRQRGQPLRLQSSDLRQKVRERKVGNLIVFVVDASASMDAEQRMMATKGAILSLLQDAYVRRDRVAVVIFKNRSAEVVLRPTSSVSLAQRKLERMSVGGTTPLTHGLLAGYQVIKNEKLRDPSVRPLMVLISDGRGNISMFKEEPVVEAQKVASLIQFERIESLVIDSARDFGGAEKPVARVAPMYQSYAINACADLAARMGARYCGLFDLSRDGIASAVERQLRR
ncbi:MAG TPA: magnesium chelatase subunit D family protein [Candidatus Dormibacteraeota bacterium]|jgi:magnesium chelatase subunit D|nr:magnesium chelatase subunit D family protein [Candidatus Dormibacteraeota bacterium]